MDLMKAKRESAYPEIRRPKRQIWIEPTIGDLYDFKCTYIDGAKRLSIDIETTGNQITCIGFSPSPKLACVLPFVDPRRMGRSYWPTKAVERQAWNTLLDRSIMLTSSTKFQTGLSAIFFHTQI